MVKKIRITILVIVILSIGVICTVAQVFKPIKTKVNENLLKNSGFLDGTQGFNITSGTLDTTTKFDGCNSIKGYHIKWKISGIKMYNTKKAFVSFKIFSNNYDSSFYPGIIETLHFKDGSTQMIGCTADAGTLINGQSKTVEFDASYNNENVDSVDIEIEINNMPDYIWMYQPKLEYGSTATPYCPSIYDNVEWDYDQYNASFQSAKVGDIKNISYYNYKKSLTEVGLFSMSIPKGTTFADKIAEDYYIFVDHKDWLLVQDVNTINGDYQIKGTDLKGLLAIRTATNDLVNDIAEYSSITDSTEGCLKYYVTNIIINPVRAKRAIPLVTMSENKNRGIVNENYTTRFKYMDEVAQDLCVNANIGYDLKPDIMNNKIVFDIVDIVDKTINQDDRNRVIFDTRRKNILSIERCKGNSTYKNVFYTTKSGGSLDVNAKTFMYYDEEDEPEGIARKETHINVSCESDSEIYKYAKFEMNKSKKIDSLDVEPSDVFNFGSVYDIGDKVTTKSGNEYVDKVIKEAEKTYDGIDLNIKLGFGDGKPQPLAYLKTMIKNKGV